MNQRSRFTIVTMALMVVFVALGVYRANANVTQTDKNLAARLPMIVKNWGGQDNQRTPSPSVSPSVSPSASVSPTVTPSVTVSPADFPLTGILGDFNNTHGLKNAPNH
jgi:hypothetical protein